ncbi:MAG: ATP-dependent DNA helicase RecG [Holosporales bacterium]|jgi:ATP-dependent DNA helicase RecG|nr:ATP-dependent DNA helicase RecG [Holosporales bacterium]
MFSTKKTTDALLGAIDVGDIKNSSDYEVLIGKTIKDALLYAPNKIIVRKVLEEPLKKLIDQNIIAKVRIVSFLDKYRDAWKKQSPFIVECELLAVSDGSSLATRLDLIFFNGSSLTWKKIFNIDGEFFITGKLTFSQSSNRYSVIHPDNIWPKNFPKHIFGPEPIYPATTSTKQKVIQRIVRTAKTSLCTLEEWIPAEIMQEFGWPSWADAVRNIHSPQCTDDLTLHNVSRQRLVFDELLAKQLAALLHSPQKAKSALKIVKTGEFEDFCKQLPFALTQAQEKAFSEIQADLESETAMLRLIQGDVGSGKTIVAFLAAAQVIFSGYQVAFLAPTDILAKQHFASAQKLFANWNIDIMLYTGNQKGRSRESILHDLKSGTVRMLIGTHALIQNNVEFQKLGLVVIDEQQRFGVEQRLKMINKSAPFDSSAHVLSLSATPIPRTLFMLRLGGISISNLYEKPQNRQAIETRVIQLARVREVIGALHRILEKGQQAYWVCPLVEESKGMKLTPVIQRFDFLRQYFPGGVSVIHGQQLPAEQQKNMADFGSGKTKILVATTIIEIGVDIPQASVIVVEHAERFGLAQLHQLRGRVGRSDIKSSCILLYDNSASDVAKQRIAIIRNCDDGFKIAEMDLFLRGSGEVFGTKQSGSVSLRMLSHMSFEEKRDGKTEFDIYSTLLTLAIKAAEDIISSGMPYSDLMQIYGDF